MSVPVRIMPFSRILGLRGAVDSAATASAASSAGAARACLVFGSLSFAFRCRTVTRLRLCCKRQLFPFVRVPIRSVVASVTCRMKDARPRDVLRSVNAAVEVNEFARELSVRVRGSKIGHAKAECDQPTPTLR